MKKQVSPALMTVVIALVVVGVAYALWHAAIDKPAYPGQNAGKPAGEVAGANQQDNGHANVPHGEPVTYEQAQHMHIPGMRPGSLPPKQSKPSGQ